MTTTRTFIVLLTLAVVAFCGSQMIGSERQGVYYHSPSDLKILGGSTIDLPLDSNSFFRGSGHCDGCHGFDATGFANTDANGTDVSPIERWRSTMMANAAKDPLWKAKVSHEVTVNPDHKVALENKCTSCHAPMGNHFNLMQGSGPFTMDSLALDTVGQDGVSCIVCHRQSEEQLGDLNSGNLNYDSLPYLYGPFDKLFTAPMVDFVGFEPVFSNRIHDAGLCAGCHTLLTESVDLDGNFTGSTFVEQATYHEWLNSQYETDNGVAPQTCQSCHMRVIDDLVVISANYLSLLGRAPYAIHDLTGANVFMLNILKNNKEFLDIRASDANFDTTIAVTLKMLQERSLDLELTNIGLSADTIYYQVDLLNKTGHKFPSGYPSRRIFVEFVVTDDANGDTLFQSGVLNSEFEVNGVDVSENFEPHFNTITSENQAQVYEIVMGDVNGNYTGTLERAFAPLKDNRLAPIGFSVMHEVYDTTMIVGNALTDDNFNHDNGQEGTGTDKLFYNIPINVFSGTLTATAKVYYQTLPPRFTEEMFSFNTPEIDTFRTMYANADKLPTLVASDTVSQLQVITGIGSQPQTPVSIFPNPSSNGKFILHGIGSNVAAKVWSINGDLILETTLSDQSVLSIPAVAGVYFLELDTSTGKMVKRLVVSN